MSSKFCAEHINDASKYNKKSFRTKISGEHRVLLGCLKGKYDIKTKTCKVSMQVVKIMHPEGEGKCPIGGIEVKKKNPMNKRTLKAEASRLWVQGYSIKQILDYMVYKYKISYQEALSLIDKK